MKIMNLAILLLFACSLIPVQAAAERTDAEWTFMVYLDADNNLDEAGIGDFLEMSDITMSDNVNIVVQFDRSDWAGDSYDAWSQTLRFHINESGMEPAEEDAVEDIGEVDMADPEVLADFIEWSAENYPAEHYALVLWNHGSGWSGGREGLAAATDSQQSEYSHPWEDKPNKGIISDDSHDSYMSIMELDEALDTAGLHLDLLGFDACLMQMIEVEYEVYEHADVIVGSEDLEPWEGWYYTPVLGNLADAPDSDAEQLGTWITAAYIDFYGEDGWQTQSAISSSEIDNVEDKLNILAELLTDNFETYSEEIYEARREAYYFGYDSIDLYSFAKEIQSIDNEDIETAAEELQAAIDAAVIANDVGNYADGANGIAIYYPEELYSDEYDDTAFAQDSSWDEFISVASNLPPGPDGFEPDNSFEDASEMEISDIVFHSFHSVNDEDWMKFTVSEEGEFIIYTLNSIETDLTVELYDSSETLIVSGENSLDVIELNEGEYYIKVNSSYGLPCEYLIVVDNNFDEYEPDDTPEDANEIIISEPQEHTLFYADEDWYYFEAEAEETYTIETYGNLEWSEQTDTYMYLYDSELTELEYNDDRSLYSKIVWECEENGTYFIKVEGFWFDTTGPYTIEITNGVADPLELTVISPENEAVYDTIQIPVVAQTNYNAFVYYYLVAYECYDAGDFGGCGYTTIDSGVLDTATGGGTEHSATLIISDRDIEYEEFYILDLFAQSYDWYDSAYESIEFEVNSNEQYANIEFKEGWNLFSVPFSLIEPETGAVFEDMADEIEVVYSYQNGEWLVWRPIASTTSPENTLTELEGGRAYWLKANEDFDITLYGTIGEYIGEAPPIIPTLDLDRGWNLVGQYGTQDNLISNLFPKETVESIWTTTEHGQPSIFGLLAGVNYETEMFYLTHGYWVYLNEDFEFIPDDSLASDIGVPVTTDEVGFGECVFLNIGDSVTVDGMEVTLENVGSTGVVLLDIDGETYTIYGTEVVEDIEITVDEYFYSDTTAERSAVLCFDEVE